MKSRTRDEQREKAHKLLAEPNDGSRGGQPLKMAAGGAAKVRKGQDYPCGPKNPCKAKSQ